MLLAATGIRAVEALSIRIKDLDLQSNPPRLFIRGKFTKTGSDRTIFLTSELAHQLSSSIFYAFKGDVNCLSGK
jgi:integrase